MMKKWIVAVGLIIIVTIVSSLGILYTLAKNPEESEFDKVKQLVLNQQLIDQVTDIYAYNSLKSYITVMGENAEGEEIAYIVDQENTKSAFEVDLSTGLSQDEAEEVVRAENKVKEILYTKLGYEEVGPVWEVTFLNKDDALSYTYVHFKTGEWWKRISNL